MIAAIRGVGGSGTGGDGGNDPGDLPASDAAAAGQSAFARKFGFLKQSVHYQPPPASSAPPAAAITAGTGPATAAVPPAPVDGRSGSPALGPASGSHAVRRRPGTSSGGLAGNSIIVSTRQRGNPLLKWVAAPGFVSEAMITSVTNCLY